VRGTGRTGALIAEALIAEALIAEAHRCVRGTARLGGTATHVDGALHEKRTGGGRRGTAGEIVDEHNNQNVLGEDGAAEGKRGVAYQVAQTVNNKKKKTHEEQRSSIDEVGTWRTEGGKQPESPTSARAYDFTTKPCSSF
jgi:hypothetical protein